VQSVPVAVAAVAAAVDAAVAFDSVVAVFVVAAAAFVAVVAALVALMSKCARPNVMQAIGVEEVTGYNMTQTRVGGRSLVSSC